MAHPGKRLLPTLLALALSGSLQAEEKISAYVRVFRDPRAYHGFNAGIQNGKLVESGSISHSILIFDWRPAPDGQSDVFQISGLDGYFKERHVAAFLREFYKLSAEQKAAKKSRFPLMNIVAASNNWGPFGGLQSVFEELSGKYGLTVFYVGGSAYDRTDLIEEGALSRPLIEEAFRRATAGEENPARNPQRRLFDAMPSLPVALDFQPLEPVPPGTPRTSEQLGNVWFTRPYASLWGTWVEWSMGWGKPEPTLNDGLAFTLMFSRGQKFSMARQVDPFSGKIAKPESNGDDPFSGNREETFIIADGELSSLSVSPRPLDPFAVPDAAPIVSAVGEKAEFLPAFLAEHLELTAEVSRRPDETEAALIARFLANLNAQAAFQAEPAHARECIAAFEKMLRTLLTLSRP
jgi:hypothetical protein